MKVISTALVLFGSTALVLAQSAGDAIARENAANAALHAQYEQSLKDQAELERLRQIEFQTWKPDDPWRAVHGATNYARGNGWKQFVGKVVEVQPNGIRVEGTYGEPDRTYYDPDGYSYTDFFVEGFPYQIAENDVISQKEHYTAFDDGVYSYVTAQGSRRTIHKLNYGTICSAPQPSPSEIAAAKAAADKAKAAEAARKKTVAENTLKWNKEQADTGDPYGQFRMGERYREGDGVQKDLAKARLMFEKSAAQGNKDAAEALKNLPSN